MRIYTQKAGPGLHKGKNRWLKKNFHFAFAAKNGGYTPGGYIHTRGLYTSHHSIHFENTYCSAISLELKGNVRKKEMYCVQARRMMVTWFFVLSLESPQYSQSATINDCKPASSILLPGKTLDKQGNMSQKSSPRSLCEHELSILVHTNFRKFLL